MPEMIGAELRFEAIGRVSERRMGNAGIIDDGIEGLALGD